MRKALLIALCLSVGFAFSAWGHSPEGQELLAIQFPAGSEPTLDGDLSDWAIVPDDYVITSGMHIDYETGVTLTDLADLNTKIIVGWSESTNRLYMHNELYDNFRKREIPEGHNADSIEMTLDGDHGGEDTWMADANDAGRYAQGVHFIFPAINPDANDRSGWYFFWMNQSTWCNQLPWADQGYTSDAASLNAVDVTGKAEWMVTLWDNLQFDDPDASDVHDLNEGEIIGLNWSLHDYDDMEEPLRTYSWTLNGEASYWNMSSVATDFLLAPVEDLGWVTAVEGESWGRIKAAFTQ